jgi:deoxyadenosine/deoxycytidine kinase
MFASKVLANRAIGGATRSSRSLCHKSYLKPKANNYRWPYERRSYGLLNFWMDPRTRAKFDENSLIIQVEGNVSAGKQDFAKKLAEELDMAYFPQPDLDSYFINDHGFDYRALNPQLPERLRVCDWEMFHENPSRHSTIHMQHYLYKLRLFDYYKALRHLFNTGQGVVMTRTAFTERAIVEAMHNVGWLPRGYLREDGARFYDWKQRYIYVRNISLSKLLQPHLCIYLDTPVDVCLDRIRNDPDPMIANSKAHTREFLEEIETAFKDTVLPKQEHNMHLLVVDNTKQKTRDDICDIIDDLSPLSFTFDHHDTRFETWNEKARPFFYFEHRRRLTCRETLEEANNTLGCCEWYDIAGLGDSITHADLVLRQKLYEAHVGEFGFNQEYDTDPKVHGFFRRIFGTYSNFGRRVEKAIRTDFV